MGKLGEKPSDDELDDMIRAVDLNGDGEIDFEEFIGLMRLRMDENSRDPEEDLRDAFNMVRILAYFVSPFTHKPCSLTQIGPVSLIEMKCAC